MKRVMIDMTDEQYSIFAAHGAVRLANSFYTDRSGELRTFNVEVVSLPPSERLSIIEVGGEEYILLSEYQRPWRLLDDTYDGNGSLTVEDVTRTGFTIPGQVE